MDSLVSCLANFERSTSDVRDSSAMDWVQVVKGTSDFVNLHIFGRIY